LFVEFASFDRGGLFKIAHSMLQCEIALRCASRIDGNPAGLLFGGRDGGISAKRSASSSFSPNSASRALSQRGQSPPGSNRSSLSL